MAPQSKAAPTTANELELPTGDTLNDLLDWLKILPPSERTAEEIEAQIRAERDAWDD